MAQDLITFACTTCQRHNYASSKNKKNTTGRLERKKYCRWCHSHTVHKETKS
ncbi:MAG: 50S ribosomal protein L33 [Candidatus Omnitrophica bacterium]|nr:50S ribosomal protein L33 [Candidatus Omnitrophota bacterium]